MTCWPAPSHGSARPTSSAADGGHVEKAADSPRAGAHAAQPQAATDTITLRIVDAEGRRNQQGRAVRLRPLAAPGRTLLRTVESGSGYLSQNGYDLLVAAPWPGDYEVEVRYAGGWVRATARPGDVLTIRADGVVAAGLR
jgi:hypothetical protein